MSDETHNIILDHLRDIRSEVHGVKEEQRETNTRLSAIENHLAGFHTTVSLHSE